MAKVNLKKTWNLISESYQRQFKISPDHIHYGPSMPTESELNLLGNVKGKKIIEIGCGGGQCSIAFAKKGAICTGIDLSSSQIDFAKELAQREGVKVDFRVNNAETLNSIKANSYDIAFSAYALQYVRNLKKSFGNVNRVLKRNGIFVFSLNHPTHDLFKFGTLKINNKSYFKKGLDVFWWKIGNKKGKAYTVNRTIEDIFNALVENRFVVEMLLEPAPLKTDKAWSWSAHGYPYKVLKKIPSTIIFKARKIE